MKTGSVILLFMLSFTMLQAQSKKKSSTVVGISLATKANKNSFSKYKIGIPTFSYAASIENRFSLHTKLNFSVQGALIFSPTLLANSSMPKSLKNYSIALNTHTYYKVHKDISIIAGAGIENPISIEYSTTKKTEFAQQQHQETKYFDASNLNPYFIIGVENSTKIFNRNLYYSLQYNFGFIPNRYHLQSESKANNEEAPSMQGVNIGLKYKY